jgi:hypothetical protein
MSSGDAGMPPLDGSSRTLLPERQIDYHRVARPACRHAGNAERARARP